MSDTRQAERNEKGQFQKGVSGNPAGRPRTSVMALWRKLNNEVDPNDPDKRTRIEVMYHKLYEAALGGDRQAAALIIERAEGKSRQSVAFDVSDREARLERKIQNYMAESEREGDPLTRAEAVAILREEDLDFEDYDE